MKIESLSGRMVPVLGDDIDTDRIIPARFLRCVSFEGIGEHAFEDDRKQLQAEGDVHAFDDERFVGASILLVNRNFGCGSSREHAPQALMRWGIKAIIGESYAEIFFGNCGALGIPCLTVTRDDIAALARLASEQSESECAIDIASTSVSVQGRSIQATMPSGPRDAYLNGTWDATGLLLERPEDVEAVAGRLPYMSGAWGTGR